MRSWAGCLLLLPNNWTSCSHRSAQCGCSSKALTSMTAAWRKPHLPRHSALVQTTVSVGRDSVPGVPLVVPLSMLAHARLCASNNTALRTGSQVGDSSHSALLRHRGSTSRAPSPPAPVHVGSTAVRRISGSLGLGLSAACTHRCCCAGQWYGRRMGATAVLNTTKPFHEHIQGQAPAGLCGWQVTKDTVAVTHAPASSFACSSLCGHRCCLCNSLHNSPGSGS